MNRIGTLFKWTDGNKNNFFAIITDPNDSGLVVSNDRGLCKVFYSPMHGDEIIVELKQDGAHKPWKPVKIANGEE